MLVSSRGDHWITGVAAEQFDYYPINNAAEAVRSLQNIRYDLIVIDDTIFRKEAVKLVTEIKRRNPSIPVIVVSDALDESRREQIFKAGADDFFIQAMTPVELEHRLNLMVKQHRQSRALAHRTQNLHAIASLSRLLYNASDDQTLMLDAVHLLVTTYRLYGVAFALRGGDVVHLYAGGEPTFDRGKLYESIVRFDRYDPFCWTIENGITQIYHNVRENPNYAQIPVLPAAESVMILPLVYQDQLMGAMGIYAMPDVALTHEDLIVFEPFAAQLAVALQKVAQYQQQYVNVQSSRHLLRGWERFANLNATHEVATALRELVEEVPHAGQSLVWFYDNPAAPTETVFVDCNNDEAIQAFDKLLKNGVIAQVVEQTDAASKPAVFDGRAVETGPLLPLFHTLLSPQVLFVPIAVSNIFIGGLFAGAGAGKSFTQEDVNLIENLVRTAGQMFYRITLTATIWEKTGRLEAILRSISEGIFFVDESDQIAFCNPQFGEMTGIQPSEVLNQPADVLLRLLANGAEDPSYVASQLQNAQTVVSRPNVHSEEYPIVDLQLAEQERAISIEFVRIEGLDSGKLNWAGLIRDSAQSPRDEATRALLQEIIADHIRMPYAQVRTQIGMLAEQHGGFSHRERDRLLHELETNFDSFGQLWLNFLDMVNLELGGVILNRELVDIAGIVQRVVNSRAFYPYHRMLRVDVGPQLAQIKGDEYRLERAIANVLYVLVNLMSQEVVISVRCEQRGNETALIFDDLPGKVAVEMQDLLGGLRQANGQISPYSFALYMSRELINRHGGHIYVDQSGSSYYAVISLPTTGVSLPQPTQMKVTAALMEQQPPAAAAEAPTQSRGPAAGARAPSRGLNSIMVIEGRSTLARELSENLATMDYELLTYRSPEDAIRDVNATRLDLIIVDTSLRDMNGVDVTGKLRTRTETPIILVADKASETEKVRGLNAGADDYIARPISSEEMMARVNTIFKRLHITDRAREPLQVGDLYVDFARREVFLANKPLELTRIEYDLLHILVTNRGQVLTHKQLLEKVWGPEYENETQYLWVNISRLRKKLEPRPDSPRFIQNQLGIGYMFVEP
ncbi:MAG: response regulator [Anaerolineae bacterium]|nr:response regulator [Anaerolineae bacterium]